MYGEGNTIALHVSIINLAGNSLETKPSRERASAHVTQFVTSPHVTIVSVTRVRRTPVLFRILHRCQIIAAGLCHVHAGYVCTCRAH